MRGTEPGGRVRATRRSLVEEERPTEAAVARTAVGVEDQELGPTTRRSGAAPGDLHLRPLADDVPAQSHPRPAAELQPEPEAGPRADIRATAGRLEDDEQGAGPPGERRQPGERIGEPGGPVERGWQVEEQQVDGTPLEERTRHREPLVERVGRDEDEPFEPDAARHGLDGIERPVEVDVRDDRAGRLRLRDEPQRQRRPSARRVAGEGEAGGARDTARPEDRVELGEAGRDDRREPGTDGARAVTRQRERIDRGIERAGDERLVGGLVRERHGRERADDLAERLPAAPRGSRPPPRTKGGERGVDRRRGRHRTVRLEQMFYPVKGPTVTPEPPEPRQDRPTEA